MGGFGRARWITVWSGSWLGMGRDILEEQSGGPIKKTSGGCLKKDEG